jgi:glycosyltransferase involved in cell wall biosynthesis
MTRVLITIGHLERGGAELRILHALQEIKARSRALNVSIFVVSGRRGALAEEFEAAGVNLIMGRSGPLGLVQLYYVLRKNPFDALHANASLAGGVYNFVAWLAGVKTRISHIRTIGYDNDGGPRRFKNAAFRLLLNAFSTRVIGVVDACRDFAATPKTRWTTIYNGVTPPMTLTDGEIKRPNSSKEIRIVMLGRVSTPKNPMRALSIVEALLHKYPTRKVRLDAVGRLDAAIGDQFKAAISQKNLDAVVYCHGESNTPYTWLRAASVLLLTSKREGLPGVILEAISVGTPVVASALPGVQEVAQRLSGITLCHLDQPDAEWSDAIICAADSADNDRLVEEFIDSPFSFNQHCSAIIRLWGGSEGLADSGEGKNK